MIETEAFLVPQTKFAYLKAIALALALIDIPEAKQDTKKRQKLEKKYDRITKVLRVRRFISFYISIFNLLGFTDLEFYNT